jgi:hypothetical protein
MSSRRSPSLLRLFHRLVALGGVALVVALGVFSASPMLHEKLHADSLSHGEDHCAVALFSSGVSLGAPVVASAPCAQEFTPVSIRPAVQVGWVSPRYLRQPERGPPGQR